MLRLAGDGTRACEIAQRLLGIARSPVRDNLKRAATAGRTDHDALESWLFARTEIRRGLRRLPEPNRTDLSMGLKNRGNADAPEGGVSLRSSRRLWPQPVVRPVPRLRAAAVADHEVSVDYFGKELSITSPLVGEIRTAEIFVAVLGGRTSPTRKRSGRRYCWLDRPASAHVRLLRRLSALDRARQPEVRRQQWLLLRPGDQPRLWHDRVGVLPARPRRPEDQAENGRRFAKPALSAGCGPSSRWARRTR